MNVMVCGSREFKDVNLFCDAIDMLVDLFQLDKEYTTILTGGARGPDAWAEKYFDSAGYLVHVFDADWTQYGKSAGFIRNERMAKQADLMFAFWDGRSKGTNHSISLASKYQIPSVVVYEDSHIQVTLAEAKNTTKATFHNYMGKYELTTVR